MSDKPNIAEHISATAVGSRVTCDPAPTNTDRDWLVLLNPGSVARFVNDMLATGWVGSGSFIPPEHNNQPPDERFYSFVNGIDNVIATESTVFHLRFIAASSVAQRLNLLDKSDRIALFQAVLYGIGLMQPSAQDFDAMIKDLE